MSKIVMDKDEFMEEHRRLDRVLKDGKGEREKERRRQKKEVLHYKGAKEERGEGKWQS